MSYPARAEGLVNMINSLDKGMEFIIEKCVTLIMKSRKRHNGRNRTTKPRKNQNARRNGNLQILGNTRSGHHQTRVVEGNNQSGEQRNYSKPNYIKGINTWAVPLARCLGPFLKWTREELQQIDQRIRKLLTMHTVLHPRDYVDRVYVSRKRREKRPHQHSR